MKLFCHKISIAYTAKTYALLYELRSHKRRERGDLSVLTGPPALFAKFGANLGIEPSRSLEERSNSNLITPSLFLGYMVLQNLISSDPNRI